MISISGSSSLSRIGLLALASLATVRPASAIDADLLVTQTNGLAEVVPGQTLTYVVTVTNQGPSEAVGVLIVDLFPTALTDIAWSCVRLDGVIGCAVPSGVGDLNELVDLAASEGVIFTIDATVSPAATGLLSNTATASPPMGINDPNPANNSAADEDPLVRVADLVLRKSGPEVVARGAPLVYTVSLFNQGPSDATVTLTDPTPAGLTFMSLSLPGCSGFPCLLDPLPAGNEEVFVVTYEVPADYQGPDPIVNVGAVASDAIDLDPFDNEARTATPVERTGVSDLEVLKKAPLVSALPPSTVTYDLTVLNHGPDDAQGVVLTETIPPGLIFLAATAPCEAGFPCSLGTIPIGAGIEVSVTLAVPADYSGSSTLDNAASVTSITNDPISANDTDTATTTLVADPIDLILTKQGPAVASVGTTLTVALEVSQNGPAAASNVILDDPIPPGLVFASASPPCAGGFACFLGSLDPDQSLTVTATFNVPADYSGPAVIENVATVTATEADANPQDNTARLLTPLDGVLADLEVTKIGPDRVAPGADATYTLTVRNLGPGTAGAVMLADPTPTGTLFVSASAPCAGGLPCSLGELSPGSAIAVGITFHVASNVLLEPMIENTATATTSALDPDPANDSATVASPVVLLADLAVVKTDGATTAAPGDAVTYTITVLNHGPVDVMGATVGDIFPPQLSGITWTCSAAAGASCTAAGNDDIDDVVSLPAGQSLTYIATAQIDSLATGDLVNTATVQVPAGVIDPIDSNDSATDTDTLVPSSDLTLTKVVDGSSVTTGDTVTFVVTSTNSGPSPVIGASVQDLFPPGLDNIAWTCTPSAGATCPASGNGDIDVSVDLPSGGSAVFTATADVAVTAPALVTNVATVSASSDPNGSNNSSQALLLVGDLVFRDAFESGDTTAWSQASGLSP